MPDSIQQLMREMKDRDATDLHLAVGAGPCFRISGQIVDAGRPELSPEDVESMVREVLSDDQLARLSTGRELDCSVGMQGVGRFRLNVFHQRGSLAVAMRLLPYEIPGMEDLGLPADTVRRLCEKSRGMVIVTGPTGCGKSTTLAAMVDYINANFRKHIVCIEDPIEYLHAHAMSIVNQREVGQDTLSFSEALRHALRQDPDVVQIGEMRDLETMQTMLTLAETGHLTLSTLHTNTAATAVNRIIDVFPAAQQRQVRVQLSFVLEAVIAQQLLPGSDGHSLELACEVLIATGAVRNLIREGDVDQIYSHMQMGRDAGMMTMNNSLTGLVLAHRITEATAFARCTDPKELRLLLDSEAGL